MEILRGEPARRGKTRESPRPSPNTRLGPSVEPCCQVLLGGSRGKCFPVSVTLLGPNIGRRAGSLAGKLESQPEHHTALPSLLYETRNGPRPLCPAFAASGAILASASHTRREGVLGLQCPPARPSAVTAAESEGASLPLRGPERLGRASEGPGGFTGDSGADSDRAPSWEAVLLALGRNTEQTPTSGPEPRATPTPSRLPAPYARWRGRQDLRGTPSRGTSLGGRDWPSGSTCHGGVSEPADGDRNVSSDRAEGLWGPRGPGRPAGSPSWGSASKASQPRNWKKAPAMAARQQLITTGCSLLCRQQSGPGWRGKEGRTGWPGFGSHPQGWRPASGPSDPTPEKATR